LGALIKEIFFRVSFSSEDVSPLLAPIVTVQSRSKCGDAAVDRIEKARNQFFAPKKLETRFSRQKNSNPFSRPKLEVRFSHQNFKTCFSRQKKLVTCFFPAKNLKPVFPPRKVEWRIGFVWVLSGL
jgi:hypothetical protein